MDKRIIAFWFCVLLLMIGFAYSRLGFSLHTGLFSLFGLVVFGLWLHLYRNYKKNR